MVRQHLTIPPETLRFDAAGAANLSGEWQLPVVNALRLRTIANQSMGDVLQFRGSRLFDGLMQLGFGCRRAIRRH